MGWVHESYSISSLNMPRDGCQNPFVISTYSGRPGHPILRSFHFARIFWIKRACLILKNGRVPVGGPFLQKLHYDGILRGMCDDDPQS